MRLHSIRPVVVLLALLTLGSTVVADLRDDVELLVRRTPLGSATVAVSIRDADTEVELVSIEGDRPMIPASNMKLLTTGAALHVLGAGFEFRTKLLRDDRRLVVVGDGDPAFADPQLLALMSQGDRQGLDVEAFLQYWVQAVIDAGIDRTDAVLVDDRVFDRERFHPRWPADQLNRAYCAEAAGLNFHLNVLEFYPRPRPGRRPALADLRPAAPWLNIKNQATSKTGAGDSNNAWIARPATSNQYRVYGNVKIPYRVPLEVTVHDPPAFFARTLAARLENAGIGVETSGTVALGAPPTTGETIGPVIATPISTVVTRCNRDSQNLYAESLLKRTAYAVTRQPGTWRDGGAILRHVMHERLGSPMLIEGTVVSDGSGLSRDNRVSARTMTAWLNSFHEDDQLGYVFLDSLAVAGQTGTLRKRFTTINLAGAHVQAKSGYINEVSCLSGYVTRTDGARRSFSILVNGLKEPGSVGRAKKMQERIVAAIARELIEMDLTLGSD